CGPHLSARGERGAGIVAGRLQQRRVGGLRQDDPHLLSDLVKAVFDDLEGGGIAPRRRVFHFRPAPCRRRVISTKPSAFILACHPPGPTIVDSRDSITTRPPPPRP